MRLPLSLLIALSCLAAGCGGGGSSGGAASTAAPLSSTAPTSSANPAPVSSAPPPSASSGSGGSGGAVGASVRTYDQRDYRLVVPTSYSPATPMPLVVFFHGSGDTGANFDRTLLASGWHAAAESEGAILVIPDTKSPFRSFPRWTANPNNDVPQMRAELAEVMELLRQDVFTRYNVELRSVHALGFSEGGLFTAAVALADPTFASHAIWGYGWSQSYIDPPARVGPLRFRCGALDSFLPNAQQSVDFLRAQGHAVDFQSPAGVGHSFSGLSAQPAAELLALLANALAAAPVAATPPAPPPSPSTGSGGTGGQPGLQTRNVQTLAQAGLPSVAIDYDVFVPSTYDPRVPLPLLVAANMGLAPWRALAEQEGVIVIDFRDHDRNGGFNFNYDVLGLNAILADVEGAFNVDTKRRYYHGFSAGAHWGYVVVLSNTGTFAGLGINAGSMGLAIQQGVWPGQVQRKIRVAIRHGVADAVVPVAAGRADNARLLAAQHPVTLEEFQGGHTVSVADAQAIWTALQTARAP